MTTQEKVEQMKKLVGGNAVTIICYPNFSSDFLVNTGANVEPVMTSNTLNGDCSCQFSVDSIFRSIDNGAYLISEEDEKILEAIKALNYEFIEF